uniref:Putative secreted protein n=1 Tax=Anopheles marajoara TaxID=58244 RepID=A0A2M4CAR8_9DIPT
MFLDGLLFSIALQNLVASKICEIETSRELRRLYLLDSLLPDPQEPQWLTVDADTTNSVQTNNRDVVTTTSKPIHGDTCYNSTALAPR